jgi:hypothetical protein
MCVGEYWPDGCHGLDFRFPVRLLAFRGALSCFASQRAATSSARHFVSSAKLIVLIARVRCHFMLIVHLSVHLSLPALIRAQKFAQKFAPHLPVSEYFDSESASTIRKSPPVLFAVAVAAFPLSRPPL